MLKNIGPRAAAIVLCALAVIITAAAFLPSLSNGFVDWDDHLYVLKNAHVKDLSFRNLKEIFSRSFVGCYCPLAIVSYAAEYRVFGADPLAYHATNYILHLTATALVFGLILLISSDCLIAFICALLFGIHPLHVESVAWISERKDLLCAVFYLASVIWYAGYARSGRLSRYIAALAAAILASFSKPMAVTIPLVLFLIDHLFGRRATPRSIMEKAPFFLLSIIFGAANIFFQSQGGAMDLHADIGVKAYFFFKAIPFYLFKLILPVRLSAIYPYHNVTSAQLLQIPFYAGLLLLLVLAAAAAARHSRKALFGSLFFLCTVLPVLKIIPAGDVFAADRYMYLPSIGLLFIGSAAAAKLLRMNRPFRIAAASLLAIYALMLASLTWERCGVWKDTERLFSDVIRKYPSNPLPYNNMGAFFAERGDIEKAAGYFEMALAADPDHKMAWNNLRRAGKTLVAEKAGRLGKPVQAVLGDIEMAKAMNEQGVAKGKAGDLAAAILFFEKAVELAPGYSESYNNLGYAYYRKGGYGRAEEYFKKAVELDPANKKAAANLELIRNMKQEGGGK